MGSQVKEEPSKETQIIIALIRGFKLIIALLEKIKKGEKI